MKQKIDFLVRIALVVLLLLGVGIQANAGSDQTLRKNGSVVGRIESNGDIRKNGSIIGKVENLTDKYQAAVMYFFDFFAL